MRRVRITHRKNDVPLGYAVEVVDLETGQRIDKVFQVDLPTINPSEKLYAQLHFYEEDEKKHIRTDERHQPITGTSMVEVVELALNAYVADTDA